jgi:hypothetical protein
MNIPTIEELEYLGCRASGMTKVLLNHRRQKYLTAIRDAVVSACKNDLVCHDQGECLRPTPETDEQELHEPYLVNELPFCVVRIDFARRLERERDEAREQIAAMREAIREAHDALSRLDDCRVFYADGMDIDNYTTDDCATARAKLQPFLEQ